MLSMSRSGEEPLVINEAIISKSYEEVRRCMEELVGIRFSINFSNVQELKPEDVTQIYGKGEVVAALYTRVSSSKHPTLHMVVFMDISSAESVGQVLLARAGMPIGEETIIDALREFANVVVGAYTAVLSRVFDDRFDYSIPEVVVDYDLAIVSDLVLPIAEEASSIVTHNVEIRSEDGDIAMEVLVMSA